jgi:hypothetical protein
MIPVILIHRGYQNYLEYSIKQAAQQNPVFFIGDTEPIIENGNFGFISPNELMDDVNDFSNIYVHLNTTPPDYEIFCYTRWFILRNFMRVYGFSKVFYIDSDVLFFENAETEWAKFDQYDMTLLHRTAGISSFLTMDGVSNFCNMLMEIYSKKEEYHFNKIRSHLEVRQRFGLPGGVCDMTLLEYFHYHSEFGGGPGRVGEMMTIIDGSTYDHNVNVPDQGFEFENGVKKLKVIDRKVFVYNNRLKRDIKFNSIHFQGGAKHMMESIYERCMEK